MRIYLDSAPIIYWVERITPFHGQVDARIKPPGVVLVSSHLALLECLVLPIRQSQSALQQEFELFFATQLAETVPLSEAICRKAAEIRATESFRTPDAIHLAAALQAGCDLFLTNDQRLKSFSGIAVEVVS